MKWLTRSFCIVISLCLFLILLISSIDYAVYYRPGFYEETFKKYHVEDEAQMELPEILKVSDYLINYLKDKEKSLEDFRAVVNGTERVFYSQREILHMSDVKTLFGYGISLRYICMAVTALLFLILLLKKINFLRTLARSIIGTFLSILGISGLLALVISADFNRAFTAFHQLFFSNDLWLLNPDEDWVIRLLPEGFFMDMAYVIFVVFSVSLFAVLAVCILYLRLGKKKPKEA